MSENHLFYEKQIVRDDEEEKIDAILSKYKNEKATPELRDKIWNDIMTARHMGQISIPVKVHLKQDPENKFPDYIEVALDTRV